MRIFAGWTQKACGVPIDTAAQSRSGEDRGGGHAGTGNIDVV